jgi:hypothetical protein
MDDAAPQDVGAHAAAMDERAEKRLGRQVGEILTGLAEPSALAKNLIDPNGLDDRDTLWIDPE